TPSSSRICPQTMYSAHARTKSAKRWQQCRLIGSGKQEYWMRCCGLRRPGKKKHHCHETTNPISLKLWMPMTACGERWAAPNAETCPQTLALTQLSSVEDTRVDFSGSARGSASCFVEGE